MDNYDINHLDPNDDGLKAVMGNRFHDETKKPMVEPIATKSTNTTKAEKKAQKPTGDAVDASWAPVKNPNWMDNLKSCAKWTVGFGGLCILFFYWQQTGQMELSAALPCMLSCTALAGFGAGRTVRKGVR
jgi:hypothetical protein